MGSGFYASLTGLMTRFQALDLLAGNLANVSTTGYKAQTPFYAALNMAQGNQSPLNRAVNDYGVLGGSMVDRQAGSIQPTGNDLDLALRGPGFFVAQTKAGLRYTRNGSFQLGPKGVLLTQAGDPVLGAKGLPIKVPQGHISISPDGVISVDGTLVDRLQVADFSSSTPMAAEGNSYYSAPADQAQPDAHPEIVQGSLEASNFNAVTGVVNLIVLQRQAGLMQQALSIFYKTMDAAAAQELPVVQP